MIKVVEICKSYGVVKAVQRVSFELSKGEVLVISGPSGSGKTTLLRLIAGLEAPDEGQIYLDGALTGGLRQPAPPHKRGIGFVFQNSALWPHMTVARNILFGMGDLPRQLAHQRLKELFAHTGLEGLERRYPSQLSGGQARRVALARALAPKPKILLLDEPLTNLDPDLKEKLLTLIQELQRSENITMIYVTHDRQEASQMGARCLTMRHGYLESDSHG